jgi:hypothetical protein
VCLVVVVALAASGTITAAVDGDDAEAVSNEEVGLFNGAFPIPNASGVGIRSAAVYGAANETVYVFGAVSCTAGEIVEVRVDVTQTETGAVASGDTAAFCLGPDFVQSWIVVAELDGGTEFRPGEASADAWARTQADGETTDTVRWNRTVTVSETYPDRSSLGSQASTPAATETETSTETTASENESGY